MKPERGTKLAGGKHAAKKGGGARRWLVVTAAIASLLAIAGAVVAMALTLLKTPAQKTGEGRPVSVKIEKGWTAREIGNELARKKVVGSAISFRIYIKYRGLEDKLRPGEYKMREGMDYAEAAAILLKGPPERYVTITIPEGYTIEQEAKVLSKALNIDEKRFKYVAENGSSAFAGEFDFLSSNGTASLEGYLFPDTYRFKPNASAEDVIRAQLARFKEVISGLPVSQTGRSVHQIVTIASLIEREAKIADERPLISAVIANRLKKGMLLQIDATVQYALPKWKKELTYKDLEIDSPYNTYKHPGLPPGPIGAPGLDSLKAAVYPADVDYLYYVVVDESGRHFFTANYSEFLKARSRSPKP